MLVTWQRWSVSVMRTLGLIRLKDNVIHTDHVCYEYKELPQNPNDIWNANGVPAIRANIITLSSLQTVELTNKGYQCPYCSILSTKGNNYQNATW